MAFERRILTNYDASTAGFDRGTRRVESQLARLQRTTDNRLGAIDRRFERAGRAALRFATALGAVSAGLGVNAVRRYAEAWRNAERQLTAAGAAVEGNREKLARLAVRVRSDFEATSGAVARFARITGDGIDASIRRVETLQKLLSVGGAAPSEAASATLQLTQGLRAGQLGGEELRAIREAAPIEFLDALAARAGGTRAELKELGAQGALTAEVIKGALDDLAQTADQRFAQLAITGSEAAEILGTGFSVFFGRLDEQFGATAGINQFLADTGRFLAEDAEAAATFAKALEVAAVATATLVGGRAGQAGLRAVNQVLVEGGVARREAVRQSQALVAATTAEVQKQRELVVARGQAFATAQRTARSAAQLEKAKRSLVLANNNLIAAEGRAAAATRALTIAQRNLSASARITTRAMNVLRGAFNFFGGVPGLILGAVSAAVLLTDAFEDQADRIADIEGRLGELGTSISRVRELEQQLESDTDALTGANERLQTAIAAQSDAAESTARIEIDAINQRIAKNRELLGEYKELIRAQIDVIRGDIAIEQQRLGEIAGRVPARVQTGRPGEGGPLGIAQSRALSAEEIAQRRLQQQDRLLEGIRRKQEAGVTLTETENEFLERRLRLLESEATLREREEAFGQLGQTPPSQTAFTPSGGGAGAGGGGGRATEEQTDALQELIAASDQRAFQLLDEIQLTKAAADEVAFLEEKQRLLNAAKDADLAITPELMATIDGLARSYADISNELDKVTAAREVIARVSEAELTATEKIAIANERLEALLPALIELLGDEAEAYRVLAAAKKQAADQIGRTDEEELIVRLTDGVVRATQQAESLNDALNRVLETIIDIIAQDLARAFDFDNQTNSVLGQLFSGIFSGVFSGSAAPSSSPIPVPRAHTGGVIGKTSLPTTMVPPWLFAGAPRLHSGGIAGLRPNEVPAILERGEIVVPKNIGLGRGGNNVTVEGSTIVMQGSQATPEELQRVLDQRDRKLIERIVQMNERDPDLFHT